MNDLTEEWKAGKLEPYKRYYVKNQNGKITESYLSVYYDELGNSSLIFVPADVVEVLAPVPSYQELRALEEKIYILKEVNKNFENYIGKFRAECENLKEKLKLAGEILNNYNYTFPSNDYHKSKDLVEYIKKVIR